ncbi:hypothetical protein [Chryseobacterium elymi]|uniref:hypothetical protein n=1 Tax=Chryseobacterium elymi TaxID=395936 RepID=UPI001EE9A0BF|nr:hypothetical protein [Chryseobacterium elymi]
MTGAGIGSIVIAGYIYWRKRNKKPQRKIFKYHKKYKTNKNFRNLTPAFNISGVKSNIGINITGDTINSEKFEKSHKYIKKDLTVGSLALELNTNTRYLSQILKQHKGKNYNINGVRINYIINKPYQSTIYRKYKINYLVKAADSLPERFLQESSKKKQECHLLIYKQF